jgi:hypothetical protein
MLTLESIIELAQKRYEGPHYFAGGPWNGSSRYHKLGVTDVPMPLRETLCHADNKSGNEPEPA